ncbi:hypothetical protein BBJ28_00012360 [Nothophytophthora sp. Chile5]|nr:hypothetical protein BBJ28_00012360 [Nothophytophthora sp. Chile5]
MRGTGYKTHEDKMRCEAWLSVNCDPIAGIYQTGGNCYGKIKRVFDEELRRADAFVAERPCTSISARFQTIPHAVSKFVACHKKVMKICASSRSPTDVKHDAVTLFESTSKRGPFKFMQCWYVLRDSPKWGAWRSTNEKRKTPRKRSSSAVSELFDDAGDPLPHPDLPMVGGKVREHAVTPLKGTCVIRAKIDRINLVLYAHQAQAAERAVANAEKRIWVAQDQLELSLFSIARNIDGPEANEYLTLKRQSVLQCLRTERHLSTASTVRDSSEPAAAISDSANEANLSATSEIGFQFDESTKEI